jgi:hypothetical protein
MLFASLFIGATAEVLAQGISSESGKLLYEILHNLILINFIVSL